MHTQLMMLTSRPMMKYKWYVEKYSSYCVRTKVFTNLKFRYDLELGPFDTKIYRYLPLIILHLCMKKNESCALKLIQVIMSKPKC